jgi:hypothetical protein
VEVFCRISSCIDLVLFAQDLLVVGAGTFVHFHHNDKYTLLFIEPVLWIRIILKGRIRIRINVISWIRIQIHINTISWVRIRNRIDL